MRRIEYLEVKYNFMAFDLNLEIQRQEKNFSLSNWGTKIEERQQSQKNGKHLWGSVGEIERQIKVKNQK